MGMFGSCRKNVYGPTASVVDGKLILSFPEALRPVLWQMDLMSVKTSALEMVDGPEGGQFGLVLRASKGEVQEIALFSTRAAALEALVTVRDALGKAHGQIRPVAEGVTIPSGGSAVYAPGAQPRPDTHQTAMRWIAGLAGLVILAVLLNMLWSVSPRPPLSIPTASSASGSGDSVPPQEKTGEPVSADDFLRMQQ